MAFTFPTNPNIGDSFYINGTRYFYTGTVWERAVKNALGTRGTKTFTATSGQTQFQCSFSVDNSEVFIDGIKLDKTDYTTNDSGLVTLIVGATVGSNVEIISYGVYDILNQIYYRQATEPTDQLDGAIWYDTAENTVKVYNGSTFNDITVKEGEYGETTTSGTSEQVIDTFDKTLYTSAEYLVTVSGTSKMTEKLVIVTDGTHAYLTSYASVGTNLGTFDAGVNSNNIELKFTPLESSSTVTFRRSLLA